MSSCTSLSRWSMRRWTESKPESILAMSSFLMLVISPRSPKSDCRKTASINVNAPSITAAKIPMSVHTCGSVNSTLPSLLSSRRLSTQTGHSRVETPLAVNKERASGPGDATQRHRFGDERACLCEAFRLHLPYRQQIPDAPVARGAHPPTRIRVHAHEFSAR